MSIHGDKSVPTEAELEAFLTADDGDIVPVSQNTRGQNTRGHGTNDTGTWDTSLGAYRITNPTPEQLERALQQIRQDNPGYVDEARKRREYQRQRRAELTPEEREEMLARRALKERQARKELTPEDIEARREYERVRKARYRRMKRLQAEGLDLSSVPPPAPAAAIPAPKTASAPPAPDPSDRRTTAYSELDALLGEFAKS